MLGDRYLHDLFKINYVWWKNIQKWRNNSDIYSNENSTNSNSKLYAIYQRCAGIAIYGETYSKLYLYKGEISNNYAKNNAKTKLIFPKEKAFTTLKVLLIAFMDQL